MHTITLENGSQLKNLSLNGNNYITQGVLDVSTFEGNLGKVTFDDGEGTIEVHEDMVLVQLSTAFEKDKTWFILADKSPEQREKEAREAEITSLKKALGQVGDVVDSILIEQLMEKGALSNV